MARTGETTSPAGLTAYLAAIGYITSGNHPSMPNTGWTQALAGYVVDQQSKGQSPETLRTRLSYLRRWAAGHGLATTHEQIVEWLARPSWSPATRKSARSALRSFYRWAYRSAILPSNPAADLDPVRVPRRLPHPATETQVAAGCASRDPDTALMVSLAAHAGLRRSEIASLRREDLTPWGLFVLGKGGKHRIIPIGRQLRARLEERPPGFIFPGRFVGHVDPSTVQRRVREAAGIATHAHRHRFATRAYAGTKDLFAVQRLLGHASPETTQIYVAIADDALAAAVQAAI